MALTGLSQVTIPAFVPAPTEGLVGFSDAGGGSFSSILPGTITLKLPYLLHGDNQYPIDQSAAVLRTSGMSVIVPIGLALLACLVTYIALTWLHDRRRSGFGNTRTPVPTTPPTTDGNEGLGGTT